VTENLLDDGSLRRFDESDHFHAAIAAGAGRRVDVVHPLDEHRPGLTAPAGCGSLWGLAPIAVVCGLDDPNDNDLVAGRTYNHFIFANTSFDVTRSLLTGFEVTSWRTLYQDRRDEPEGPTESGESVVLQWMVRYGF